MRRYYFVGGPRAGSEPVFLHQLEEVGGAPSGWRIYPHADKGGQALHIVDVEDETDIDIHLSQFGSLYERGPIVEVVAGRD
jgi:hypothetical protein